MGPRLGDGEGRLAWETQGPNRGIFSWRGEAGGQLVATPGASSPGPAAESRLSQYRGWISFLSPGGFSGFQAEASTLGGHQEDGLGLGGGAGPLCTCGGHKSAGGAPCPVSACAQQMFAALNCSSSSPRRKWSTSTGGTLPWPWAAGGADSAASHHRRTHGLPDALTSPLPASISPPHTVWSSQPNSNSPPYLFPVSSLLYT